MNINKNLTIMGSGVSMPVESNFSVCENVEKVWLEASFQAARKEVAWGRNTYAIQHVQVLSGKVNDKNTVIRKFVDDNGKSHYCGFKMSVESQDEDVLFRQGFVEVANKGIGYYTINGATVMRKIDNYSDTLLSIDFVDSLVFNGSTRLDDVLRTGHVLRLSSKDNVGYYVMTDIKAENGSVVKGYTKIYNPENVCDLTVSQVKELIEKNGDVKVDIYWAFVNNPSRQRQSSCLFIKGEEGPNGLLDRKYQEERMEAILDKITYGAYSVMKMAYGNEDINFSKLYKIFSRFSLPMTGSSVCGKIGSVAWFHGDFKHDGVAFADGSGFLSSDVFKKHWANGALTDPNVCGNLVQARFGTVKGCHNVVSKKAMAEIIRAAAKKMNAEIVFIDKNQSVKYWAEMQLGLHKNKIVVIGANNLESVDFFGDDSTFKTAFDFSLMPFDLNVMAVPKGLNGNVGISLQCASSFLKVDGAHDVLLNIGKKHVDKILRQKRSIRFDAVKDVLFPDNTLIALGSNDKNTTRSWLDNSIKSVNNAINMFAFDVEGFYGLITFDLGVFFGVKILKNDEMFVNDRRFWNKRCVAIRYPHNCAGEHKKAKIVSIDTIKERLENLLNEGIINESVYWLLIAHYRNIKSGVIVVQSTDKKFGALLGGCDYDGDGITVITDPDLVALWDNVPQCAIDFGSPAPNPAVARFSTWFLNDGYRAMVNNSNDKIGIITNRNMSFMSFESLKDFTYKDMDTLAKMISKEVGLKEYAGYNHVYELQFDGKEEIVIDASAVETWDKLIKFCGISNRENLINILNDAQKVNSSVVGRTIDSAKSGEIVLSPLAGLFSIIKGGIIQDVSINIKTVKENNSDVGRKEVVVKKINTGFQTKKSGKPVFIAGDIVCRVKNELADYAAKCISKYI